MNARNVANQLVCTCSVAFIVHVIVDRAAWPYYAWVIPPDNIIIYLNHMYACTQPITWQCRTLLRLDQRPVHNVLQCVCVCVSIVCVGSIIILF